MVTQPTQATGSMWNNKGGMQTGGTELGGAFLGNQATPQTTLPTISAPVFGSMSGGLGGGLMPFPETYVPSPIQSAPKQSNAVIPNAGRDTHAFLTRNFKVGEKPDLTQEELLKFQIGRPRFHGGR